MIAQSRRAVAQATHRRPRTAAPRSAILPIHLSRLRRQRVVVHRDGLQGQITGVNQRVDVANAGVAMAMALTGGYLPDSKKFAVSISYGTFERQNAAAMSGYLRLNENVVLSGGLSYGVEAKQFGGRAGMLFAWQGNRSRVVE